MCNLPKDVVSNRPVADLHTKAALHNMSRGQRRCPHLQGRRGTGLDPGSASETDAVEYVSNSPRITWTYQLDELGIFAIVL